MNRVLTSTLLLVVAVVSLALAQTSVQQTGQGQTNWKHATGNAHRYSSTLKKTEKLTLKML